MIAKMRVIEQPQFNFAVSEGNLPHKYDAAKLHYCFHYENACDRKCLNVTNNASDQCRGIYLVLMMKLPK